MHESVHVHYMTDILFSSWFFFSDSTPKKITHAQCTHGNDCASYEYTEKDNISYEDMEKDHTSYEHTEKDHLSYEHMKKDHIIYEHT